MEIWKVCSNADDLEVSSLGRVRGSRSGVMRKPRRSKGGYLRINSQQKLPSGAYGSKTFYIHRMVASAHIPNPKVYVEINHIDCNKENNAVSNLEWCSHADNMKHAKINGLIKAGLQRKKANG